MTSVRIHRVVIRAGGDTRAAQRLTQNLPAALHRVVDTRELHQRRDVERALRDAAREARE